MTHPVPRSPERATSHPVQRPDQRPAVPPVAPSSAPPPHWVMLPARTIRPTRTLARVAVACAGVFALASVVQTALGFPAGAALAVADDLESATADSLLMYDLFAVVYTAAALAAWVTTSLWLSRARANAEVISTTRHERSPAWVWLGWVIPVVAFWFPRQVVRDVHRASHPEHAYPPRLALWWGLWLAATAAGQAADRIATAGDLRFADMLGTFNAVSTALLLAALVPWVTIVRRIVELQEGAAAAAATAGGGVVRTS